jgi:membrane protein YdbS with pleckstrin-like domain
VPPRTANRTALTLIPVSILVGIVAVLLSNWAVLAAMVLSVVVQVVNLVLTQRRQNRYSRGE